VPRPEPRSLRIAYQASFAGVPTSRAMSTAVELLVLALEREGVRVEEREPGFSVAELNQGWNDFFRFAMAVMVELTGAALPVKPPDGPSPKPADFVRVLAQRDILIQKLERLLGEYDAYLCPTSITTAFVHSPPRSPIPVDGNPVESRFVDHYLYPFNFTGSPAVVVPAGLADDGLPVGVQLVGARWGDERLLAVAEVVSEIAGGIRTPPLSAIEGSP